jgi:protoporphyrinogen oxidase
MKAANGTNVAIIGAGPAGLTAAYQLCKAGIPSIVLEKDSVVGGIARTVRHDGCCFDIGGHRFFTKVQVVEDLWHEILSETDFLKRSRLSRIYYKKKFFDYPLRLSNALFGLGFFNSFLILASYLHAWLFPIRNEKTFEDWVCNRFGRRFYHTFFKTYTEKVWGIPCSQLSAEWAAQRIRGLSLKRALKSALLPKANVAKRDVIKTLIHSFHYPKKGPGMLWETVAEIVQKNGCTVHLNSGVERILWQGSSVTALDVVQDDQIQRIEASHFISSMPLRELIEKFHPSPPAEVCKAAARLGYRDFLTVGLVITKPDLFPDNWIYIHDPQVKVGRIQNFKNWSPYMVSDSSKSCVGLEYFCFEGDSLWDMSDSALIELAKKELETLGLGRAADVESGTVARMPKAYPVYDTGYGEALNIVRQFLAQFENLYTVGRNGMHKYNNQDHSMLTAMFAVENIQGRSHNIWAVNDEQEYLEQETASSREKNGTVRDLAATQPQVPFPLSAADPATVVIRRAFARIDGVALGAALSAVSALYVFLPTVWLIITGTQRLDPGLYLLSQYFIGYKVSWRGAFLGLFYGAAVGFVFGWSLASLRNGLLRLYLRLVKIMEEIRSLQEP